MTGLFRFLFLIFLGYILVKAVRFVIKVFKSVPGRKEGPKVYETSKGKRNIDKKDVIDAQFEEIDNKEHNTSK